MDHFQPVATTDTSHLNGIAVADATQDGGGVVGMLTHFQGAIGSVGFDEPLAAGGGCSNRSGGWIDVRTAADRFDIGNFVATAQGSPGGQGQTQGKQQPPGVDRVGCRRFGYGLWGGLGGRLGNSGSLSRWSKRGLAVGDRAG